MLNDSPRDAPGIALAVYVCVCVYVYVYVYVYVCVFSKTAFPLYLKVLQDTLGVSEVFQGLLRCLGGGITRGDAGIALAF